MLIGIDFDNTIVCYDDIFHRAAVDQGLISKNVGVSKGSVRDYLRASGKEDAWTALQGMVYGDYIKYAPPFPGAMEFLRKCNRLGIKTYIISHKTEYPFLGITCNLHDAAHLWLENNGFYDQKKVGMNREQVYFELTKEEKLQRIAKAGCSHFIDDLPEFLEEPQFPAGVTRILFDPNRHYPVNGDYLHAISWKKVEKIIFGNNPVAS
jgi:methionine salvage enolase-phosphatase E1